MITNFIDSDIKRAEIYNDDVEITLSTLIRCTLEEEDIITWINGCQSKKMIDNIIREANKRKRYLMQDNDDDFRSRA